MSSTRYSTIVSIVSFHSNICVLLSNPAVLRVFTRDSNYTQYHSIDLDAFYPMYDVQGSELNMLTTTQYIIIYAVDVGIMLCIELPLTNNQVNTSFGSVNKIGYATITCSVLPLGINHTSLSQSFLQYLSPGFRSPVYNSLTKRGGKQDRSPQIKLVDTYVTSHNLLYSYTVHSNKVYIIQFHNTSQVSVDVTNKQSMPIGSLTTVPLNDSIVISNAYTVAHNRLVVETKNNLKYHIVVDINTMQYDITQIDSSHTVDEPYQRSYSLLNDMLSLNQPQYDKQMRLASNPLGPALDKQLSRDAPAIDGGMIFESDTTTPTDDDHTINSVLVPYSNDTILHFSHNKLSEILLYEIQAGKHDNRLVEFTHRQSCYLQHTAQLVLIANISYIDQQHTKSTQNILKPGSYIAIVNLNNSTVRYIPHCIDQPITTQQSAIPIERITRSLGPLQSYRPYGVTEYTNNTQTAAIHQPSIIFMCELNASELCVLLSDYTITVYEIDPIQLQHSVSNWRKLFGEISADTKIHMDVKRDKKTKDLTAPKHGKVDDKNEQHVGGNTWRGGSGGSDTAGLGGRGGPYRVDGGHQVNQISDEQKRDVSAEIKAQAKLIAAEELAKRLKEIDMSIDEDSMYIQYYSKVEKQINQLRTIFQSTQSKQIERQWLTNQNQGDLDDNKLIDAVTGNRLVYRRRGNQQPMDGAVQKLPKKLLFVMDVSGSMYRFNSTDQRLQRLLETCLLIMESFIGLEHKFDYSILGHSGDSPNINFVSFGSPPQNRKQRFQILQRMYSHTQYCSSGDNTLDAIIYAIKDIKQRESDESFVFVVSDANLRRYNIEPSEIATALSGDKSVNAYIVFIASSGNEASQTLPLLPPGSAFFTQNTHELPQIFQNIFQSTSMLQDTE